MKRTLTYYGLGLLAMFGLVATGVQAFEFSNVSILRESYSSRARFEVLCERTGEGRLDFTYICDGRPKPPPPTPASCGNSIVESGEQCDGSAPAGFVCSNSCQLVDAGNLPVCGNSVQESGEQCDGSAPAGYACNNRCELVDLSDANKGKVVINEIYYDADATHGVEPSNQWIELYNAGTTSVDLNEWTLTDNSGVTSVIGKSVVLTPGQFAILTSEASTSYYWDFPEGTKIVIFGTHMGNGLDIAGDSLTLRSKAEIMDRVSWGNDKSVFNLQGVRPGSSLSRLANGYDTNTASDWQQTNPPTPGF